MHDDEWGETETARRGSNTESGEIEFGSREVMTTKISGHGPKEGRPMMVLLSVHFRCITTVGRPTLRDRNLESRFRLRSKLPPTHIAQTYIASSPCRLLQRRRNTHWRKSPSTIHRTVVGSLLEILAMVRSFSVVVVIFGAPRCPPGCFLTPTKRQRLRMLKDMVVSYVMLTLATLLLFILYLLRWTQGVRCDQVLGRSSRWCRSHVGCRRARCR